jgi:hypothetical protein
MQTYIRAIIPADEKWKAMKAAWDACKAIKQDPPKAVLEFFDYDYPKADGKEIGLMPCHTTEDALDIYEIDLKTLPENATKIRFYNSW